MCAVIGHGSMLAGRRFADMYRLVGRAPAVAEKFIPLTVRNALRDRKIPIYGDGPQR
ncbi:hypothetical protein OHB12_18940 [Nocardia sp. NBC_01730]|uniref:hypothetical protein n=1 Tax=Nocardia sp. NBC_01730 TaxID=2975998 RepID=UPI002E0FB04B|nr:hypothetical protein OHB12_18940 [Nocardia sp. NBC_01730]